MKSKYSKNSQKEIFPLIKQAKILSSKYDIVVTNPPYMGGSGMNKKLADYLKKHFSNTKKDFFSAFIEKSFSFSKNNAHVGLLTPYVWMFIQSFLKLREKIVESKTITTLTQLEYNAFPEACVPVCVFTFKNEKSNTKGQYIKLSDFKGSDIQETKTLEAINNPDCGFRFITNQNEFLNIPGTPIAYWVEPELINAFRKGTKLSTYGNVLSGIITGNTDKFLRKWHEISFEKMLVNNDFDKTNLKYWIPYNKGGSFKKWYGNQEYVINWKNGPEDKQRGKKNFKSYYLKEHISWSLVTSGTFCIRYFPKGFLWDVAGPEIFNNENIYYLAALLNSPIGNEFLKIINPTLNYPVDAIKKVPVIMDIEKKNTIEKIVLNNIILSKEDWNRFEESWNFSSHPLINFNDKLIENSFNNWNKIANCNFYNIKENEEKINKMFIDIYNLKDSLSHKRGDKDITLSKADLKRDIKSLLSYFIGCLFGRYSLDKEGLIYAGGEYDSSNYSKFIPDEDDIVPILDTEYFQDDILNKFIEFLKITFSEETLEENLKFIANALGNKGKTYRETIRKYFLTDFYKDHVKTYKKTPIYWMFNSGKENGFNALIYLHRYTPDTVARIRTEYLHKTQKALETTINNNEQIILYSSNQKEKNEATKENVKLKKQLAETLKYDEALAHIANKQIELDLDDGVKVNYAKFQGVEVGNKKIDLLKKI